MNSTDLPLKQEHTDYGAAPAPGDLYAIFELTPKPDTADALRRLMLTVVAKARAEPGVKHCALLSSESEANRIITYEIWTSHEALQTHMAMPHILELRSQLRALLAKDVKVEFLNAVSPG